MVTARTVSSYTFLDVEEMHIVRAKQIIVKLQGPTYYKYVFEHIYKQIGLLGFLFDLISLEGLYITVGSVNTRVIVTL